MSKLEGKVALITGGTSGIGRATAVTLAKAGAKVVVTGRRENEGQETVRLMNEAGGEGFFVRTDVKNEPEIEHAVQETLDRYGRLDIAVNNAGVELFGGTIDTISRDEYLHLFDINVWGVIASLKREIPAMLKSGGGSIINVTSGAGHVGMPGATAYCASKGAVELLTKSTALEFATQGIRVNAVAPAVIATDMAERAFGAEVQSNENAAAMHPMNRVGKPQEVATTILWLASEDSSFVTGSSIPVDGGFLAR